MPRRKLANNQPGPDGHGAVGLTDRAVCDDCGGSAQIVVSELITRECDVLCWRCMFTRAITAAEQVTRDASGGNEGAPRL